MSHLRVPGTSTMGAVVLLMLVSTAATWADPGLAPSGRSLAAPAGTEQLDLFVGHWEVREIGKGDDAPIVARSHGYYILDGFVLQEDYRGLDPAGHVGFRGTSIRTFDPATGKIAIQWMVASSAAYTHIVAERDGDDIVSTGEGRDWAGREFMERFRYFDITADSRKFEMERSYDGGETWQAISRIVLSRAVESE